MLVMLTKAVRDALNSELAFCKAQRDKYDAKAKALEAILEPDDQLGFFDSPPTITVRHDADTIVSSNVNRLIEVAHVSPSNGNGNISAMGWRDAIRYVLDKYPTGLTARDVAEKLEHAGKKSSGKVSTVGMISSEMSRMKTKGFLTRDGNKYRPVSTGRGTD